MKNIVSQWSFSAAAKTVSCQEFATVGLRGILMIANVTRGAIIYYPGSPTSTGTLSGSTLTLTYDTTGHSDSDVLQIFYDNGDTGSTEQTLSSLAMSLMALADRLEVFSNGRGALYVDITGSAAAIVNPSVTISGTATTSVSTLGSATFDAIFLLRSQMAMAAANQLSATITSN